MTDGLAGTPAEEALYSKVPHSARIWNYWLGGKDNYQVDRDAGDAWIRLNPEIQVIARQYRSFLQRVVRFLAGEAGIRQFLDVGTGLPTADNTHSVAQRVAPDARIVYVDNDPLVLAHARALLTSTPEGSTKYLHADMNDVDGLVEGAAKILDFTEPVAIILMGVLGHVPDLGTARALVANLVSRVPSGSYLAIADGAPTPTKERAQQQYAKSGAVPYMARKLEEIESFFDGMQLISPGFVSISAWRPDQLADDVPVISTTPIPVSTYGAVALKP
jgi:O-methyltransferase involved in polyketide biosynthesis